LVRTSSTGVRLSASDVGRNADDPADQPVLGDDRIALGDALVLADVRQAGVGERAARVGDGLGDHVRQRRIGADAEHGAQPRVLDLHRL
jgi:hypothetical protein